MGRAICRMRSNSNSFRAAPHVIDFQTRTHFVGQTTVPHGLNHPIDSIPLRYGSLAINYGLCCVAVLLLCFILTYDRLDRPCANLNRWSRFFGKVPAFESFPQICSGICNCSVARGILTQFEAAALRPTVCLKVGSFDRFWGANLETGVVSLPRSSGGNFKNGTGASRIRQPLGMSKPNKGNQPEVSLVSNPFSPLALWGQIRSVVRSGSAVPESFVGSGRCAWVKVNHQSAGFSPCFQVPGFHFRVKLSCPTFWPKAICSSLRPDPCPQKHAQDQFEMQAALAGLFLMLLQAPKAQRLSGQDWLRVSMGSTLKVIGGHESSK